MNKNLIKNIESIARTASPKQKLLADYVTKYYKNVAFQTSTNLANSAKVSEPTVIRFVSTLGYSGYKAFQEDLQQIIQNELSTLDRFSVNADDTKYQRVFGSEVAIINRTLEEISQEKFNKMLQYFENRDKVVIVGFAGSSCLADYCGYILNKILPDVRIINKYDCYIHNYLNNLNSDTLAIVFAFPRYPQMTVEILDILKKKGVPIVCFTDSMISPFAEKSDCVFVIRLKHISYIDPYAAVMCLINSMVENVSLLDIEKTKRNLENFEKYVERYNEFYKG